MIADTNLDPTNPNVLANFWHGLRGSPVCTETLAWRLGNDLVLRPGGRAIAIMAEKVPHAETGWTESTLRATIAGGIPQSVNMDRWQERIETEARWHQEKQS